MSPPLPTFVIIGAMKAGTTSLARWLGAHPDVHLAPDKEIDFFDLHWGRGVDWYRQRFAGWRGEPQVGEASVSYVWDPRALPRLVGLLPDARLVLLLRDPVERAHSHYWHERSRRREPLGLLEALRAEPGRLAAGGADAWRQSYVDRSRYSVQLERLGGLVGPDRLEIVLFEDLRDDPVGTYAAVCRGLGLDAEQVPDLVGRPLNPRLEIRSARAHALLRRLPRQVSPVRNALSRLNVRAVPAPPLSGEERRALTDLLGGEREAVAAHLGRRPRWGDAADR